jgi:hypothetical protein
MIEHSEPEPALSDTEHDAIKKSAELATLIRNIIGDGLNSYHDWVEATVHIHAIQNMILSQAASRAYPDLYRLLGEKLPPAR